MKKGKKIAIIALMAIVAIAGTIGGIALAQDDEETTTPTPSDTNSYPFLERACEIYQENTGVTIYPEQLKDALCQAGEEQMEQARNQWRQKLIDEGIVTEEQLNAWEEWLKARPDFPTEEYKNWMESRPAFPTDEFKSWMESRPDDLPKMFGFGNQEGKRFDFGFGYNFGNGLGKGFGEGFGGLCLPDNGTE